MRRDATEIRSTASVRIPARKPQSSRERLRANSGILFALALLFADAVLVVLIISYVPYTKIDWDAYMSQVSGFLGGERDYRKLEGDTGPLVYPSGFLYIYSAIQFLTGGEVYAAQSNDGFYWSLTNVSSLWLPRQQRKMETSHDVTEFMLFGFLYIVNLGIVLFIYLKTDVLPWWALCLLSLSKRVHSIFLLRLFNDCFATTLFHASLVSFIYQKWHLGLIIFSGAVSVKMNVLLYAPPLLILLLKAMDIYGVVTALAGAALVQILLGLPFILSHPVSYISRAFNLGRIFIHFWSVNFKFVPEQIFVSRGFALFLLVAHLMLLVTFAHYRWCSREEGLFTLIRSRLVQLKFKITSSAPSLKESHNQNSTVRFLTEKHITTTMFVGNFIGIVCARSLHYQFYSWYFYSLPYLLWQTLFPTWLRLILFATVELCWNIYPSNVYSSVVLLFAHATILAGLWKAPSNQPYLDDQNEKIRKS